MGLCNVIRPTEPAVAIPGQKYTHADWVQILENKIRQCNFFSKKGTEFADSHQSYCNTLAGQIEAMIKQGISIGFAYGPVDNYEFVVYVDVDGFLHLHKNL